MKAEEFLKQATKGTEAGEVIEESNLRLAIIALLDNYREIIVKECSIPNVSNSDTAKKYYDLIEKCEEVIFNNDEEDQTGKIADIVYDHLNIGG